MNSSVRDTVTDFGTETSPYGIFAPSGQPPRVGVAVGTRVLDLSILFDSPEEFAQPTLNAFLERGPERWAHVRQAVKERVTAGVVDTDADVHRQADVEVHLPIAVSDFVDFFSGIEHAINAGRVLRPDEKPLKPNYRHLPVGYHGRAGTVVPSGTDVVRPNGQTATADGPIDGPSRRLDFEIELGYVVGVGSTQGRPVPAADFRKHVFGVVILLDWSARDIQAWEYQPLGPFLGKSFCTTISSWVVPLSAIDEAQAWVPAPDQEPGVLPYLHEVSRVNPAVGFEVDIDSHLVTSPSADSLYWTPAQQLAHMTHNGASLRTGDLWGTGTVSSFDRAHQGSLLEITAGGTAGRLGGASDSAARSYLEDGERVTVRAYLSGDRSRPLGAASGAIVPAPLHL